MSHKAVRQLIRDTAKSLADNIQFVYARKTDFNQIRDKKFPFIQLELLNSKSGFNDDSHGLITTYPVVLTFYQLDSLEGAEDASTNILDATDNLVQQFIRKMNLSEIDEPETDITIATKNIILSSFNCNSFVKMTADCLTGWIVTFNMQVPDDFDYCSIY